MKHNKKTIRTELLGANFATDGTTIEFDWRYEVLMDFLQLSHSYKAVLLVLQGQKSPYPLPADFAAVEAVVKDFQDIRSIGERIWWDKIGKGLFGIRAPDPDVELIGRLNQTTNSVASGWQGADSLVVNIPVGMKPSKVLRQLKELLSAENLPVPPPPIVSPKYKLASNKLRYDTLTHGEAALRKYEQGVTLRKIGDWLNIAPNGDDTAICSATRRLITQAALIAENAARGRFFSDKPFPEALTDTYRRKAGRPVGTKGIPWDKNRLSVNNLDAATSRVNLNSDNNSSEK